MLDRFIAIHKERKKYVLVLFVNFILADINGTAKFSQNDVLEDLTITVANVQGLKDGKHGFHIHANGDCKDPGPHFNPKMVIVENI